MRRADQIWIAYVVTALTVSAQAFFEPARTATIPNVTAPEELLPANALSSATWSAMLAIGASVGGLVTAVFGRNVAFVVNAASFFVSCLFIAATRYDATPASAAAAARAGRRHRRLRSRRRHPLHPPIVARGGAACSSKPGWGLAGGILLLLTIFGQRVFPVGGSTAAGIGVLYGARGIGAALGPILLRWILGQKPSTLRRAIGPAYFIIGVFYAALSAAPGLLHGRRVRAAGAFRRLDSVGVQHRAAADGGAGSNSGAASSRRSWRS